MNVRFLTARYSGIGGAEAFTRSLVRAVAAGGGRVDTLSLLAGEARPTPWAYAGLAAEAIRRIGDYDLLVCSHVALAPIGMALRSIAGVPYVCLAHGIEVWGRLGPVRRRALHGVARIVAVSEFTAAKVSEIHGVPRDRISVVYPPVDPALLAAADAGPGESGEGGPVTFLTVARLSAAERYKGCDTVIRALPSVAAQAGPLRYVIVGDGDDRPRLEALADHTGVGALVTFRGSVTGEELAAHYRACDAFVMPSIAEQRPTGWAGEGFGIVYLEAAAFGRPVVAGSGGGAPEAVQDGVTGILVDGADTRAVTAALVRLATDTALRVRMGEAGRRWVRERFGFERFQHDVAAAMSAAVEA